MGLKQRLEWWLAGVFGRKVASVDQMEDRVAYVLAIHWRGRVYVVDQGEVMHGGLIYLPPGFEFERKH